MRLHLSPGSILMFCVVLWGPGPAPEARPQGNLPAAPQKVRLSKAPFKAGTLRLGYDLAGDPPLAGWRATLSTEVFWFFDLDGDGVLSEGKDGVALHPYPFVVPIPEVLLLRTGQYKVGFDGVKELVLTAEDLGPARSLLADAALVTELRFRAGVRPARLDPKACAAAEKHCDYLMKNGLADGSGGLSAHDEKPGNPGYSQDGAAAGKNGNIGFAATSLRAAVLNWYATAWHGAPIVDPSLENFGLAFQHGVALMYFSGRGARQARISLHPPDGAINVSRAFGERGEAPNPVPGTTYGRGCGFPILARLAAPYRELTSAEVVDLTGRRVAGTCSSPAKPANPEWPTNSECAVFIPSKPLTARTTYRVRFQFAEQKDPVVWTFTTGE